MKIYELTHIVSDSVAEQDVPKETEKVKKIIGDKILEEKFWGRRKLAYPIKKNDYGYYITLVFNPEAKELREIDSKIKMEEGIIRHLIISKVMPPAEEKKPKPSKEKAIKPKVKVEEKPKEEIKPEKPKKAKPSVKLVKKKEVFEEKEKMKELEEKLEKILKE